MPTLLSPPSLTRVAVPFLEAGHAWVPLLNWGGVDTAWLGALGGSLLKGLLYAMFGWDKSLALHQGLKELMLLNCGVGEDS